MNNNIKAEWNIDETKKKYWEKIRHPFNGGFELTQKCNFRCVHCYLQNGGYKDFLSTQDVKLILDKLAQKGILFLYFTGGEVFTRKDFEVIWRYAKKLGFVLEILTNASLISHEILSLFDELPPATISISVYGASEESYSAVTQTKGQYQKVIRNLKALKEHGLHFDIKFIGMRENINDFYGVQAIAESLNVQFSHSFEIFPAFGGKENVCHMISPEEIVEFEKNYEETRRIWTANAGNENIYKKAKAEGKFIPLYICGVGTTTCIVDAEGYLLPCNKLRIKKHNLLTDEFDSSWNDYASIKKIPAPGNYKCLTCEDISVCDPCPAQNFLATGRYDIPCLEECRLAALRNSTFGNKG